MENFFTLRYKIVFISLLAIIAFTNIYTILNQNSSTITVTGLGSLTSAPGKVEMVVTGALVADTADIAITNGENYLKNLIEVAKKISGPDTEIKQSQFQVTPQDDGKFLIASAISIKTTNVSATNNLIKSLYANGATTISNVSFSPIDDDETEKKSRELALVDAKKKADVMAKSMGKKIGKVVSIAEDTTLFNSSIKDGTSISLEKRISVVYAIK